MYAISNEYIHNIRRVCEALIASDSEQSTKTANDKRIALKTLKYINRKEYNNGQHNNKTGRAGL